MARLLRRKFFDGLIAAGAPAKSAVGQQKQAPEEAGKVILERPASGTVAKLIAEGYGEHCQVFGQ